MSRIWILKKNAINLYQINKQVYYGKLKERKTKKMKDVKIKMVLLETGEIKEFGGWYTLKELYNLLKTYEKNERFEILSVEFSASSNGMFDDLPDVGSK